ncbi:roadblock/LC7 domain-containing protein [Actinocatenispora sera]|uniref:Roadblock/LAMTOR2 domain-containing protein n=1 Tax=Actinocatenispora sera TaxID=390989 RepID=A0A810L9E9_9ACTN|nr:roadblock/LC7 domain-containing protein [Actinocatenispora sera]BCJ32190.1 hypothetical protein Asera_62980 [Actinocatenispora sera]
MTDKEQLRWLLEQFMADSPGVTHVVVTSLDGLRLVTSASVDRDLGDSLSALSAGLLSMASRTSALLALGDCEYMTLRLAAGHLLLMRIDEASGVIVAATPDADLRIVAYNMTHLFGSASHALSPQLRTTPSTAGAPGPAGA